MLAEREKERERERERERGGGRFQISSLFLQEQMLVGEEIKLNFHPAYKIFFCEHFVRFRKYPQYDI